ncbi:U1 small nuclear ribonucleoprotein C [Malassezia japonica]|uniref:U1 small nuclear ribonucleoprotein C n=1 Tax=Malassezia japonica TaxID=223818 RepID=A0AAF0JBS8_9BASI|nr:U1 small nuclear ribonucleoprotein C [Malassezia japonica]WFD40813.1 U1 small nuclear ribonucleoprotein C [Malassezia japonica]
MGKHYCDYCDVFLTHDSTSVRKAHNCGRNHLQNVRDYYASLPPYEIQGVVDTLMKDYQKRGYPPPLELLGPYGRPPPMVRPPLGQGPITTPPPPLPTGAVPTVPPPSVRPPITVPPPNMSVPPPNMSVPPPNFAQPPPNFSQPPPSVARPPAH